jgi:hypothetical protein
MNFPLLLRKGRAAAGLLLCLAGVFPGAAAQAFYVKKATRAETRAASLAAIEARFGEQGYTKSPWLALGPFDNARNEGYRRVFPPELKVDLTATYAGLGGQSIRWQPLPEDLGDAVNFIHYAQGRLVTAYAVRTIVAERDLPATLLIGSDPNLMLWLNGERILDDPGPHPLTPDSIRLEVQLNKGTNTLLAKMAYQGGGFGFSCKITARSRAELARKQELLDALEERLERDFPEGESAYYRIENISGPEGVVLEVGGMAFRSDGKLFLCTRRGEVWLTDLTPRGWKLFASGLHEPLGLLVEKDNQIVVAQRPELTRITDTDGDGAADEFATVADQFGVSGNFHEYHYGPVRDRGGNLIGTLNVAWNGFAGISPVPFRGWAYKVTPAGQFAPIALGMRSPSGLGISPDGDVFVIDSQGDWWGASPLLHLKEGAFYGHPASLVWAPGYKGPPNPHQISPAQLAPLKTPVAAWFVYGPLGQSPEEPVWDTTGGKFGPFGGQMFVGDQSRSIVMRVALEKVGGEWQGAIFPFRAGFASGIVRSVFAPDGSLLLGQTDRGWGAVGGKSFALQRLVWTGRVPMEILTMRLQPEGFELTFTQPVDPATASLPGAYSLSHFHYLYHPVYGSPKQDVTPVKVKEVRLSADRRTVTLVLPELAKEKIYELHLLGLTAADGTPLLHPDAYYSLQRLPAR